MGERGKVEGGSWATERGEKRRRGRRLASRWKNGAGRVITKYKGWAGPRHRAQAGRLMNISPRCISQREAACVCLFHFPYTASLSSLSSLSAPRLSAPLSTPRFATPVFFRLSPRQPLVFLVRGEGGRGVRFPSVERARIAGNRLGLRLMDSSTRVLCSWRRLCCVGGGCLSG